MNDEFRLISADRLFDGEGGVVEAGAVLVQNGRIVAVGERDALRQPYADAALVEEHFANCTLLPGLIDAHCHLIMPGTGVQIVEWSREPDAVLLMTGARNAWLSLQSGVTTLADLGAKGTLAFELRATQSVGITVGSRLALCGRALTITGGHAWPWGGEADGVEGVRQAVRQLCKEGADFIKAMVTGGGTPGTDGRRPSYSPAELHALVDEAHTRNRKVFGHCTAHTGILRAVDAGFDLIAHCQFLLPDGSTRFDAELVRRMVDRGIFVNPTLQINRILASNRVDWSKLTPDRQRTLQLWVNRYGEFADAFARMAQMGVRMVCGSDCGWGYSTFDEVHLELDAMVEAGLAPTDALTSATGNAADALGWGEQLGRLRPGLVADLLVVEGDPTRHVADLQAVRQVWLDGKPVVGGAGFAPLVRPWSVE
jgi:imidazolonepropionase-like amidohydrolase